MRRLNITKYFPWLDVLGVLLVLLLVMSSLVMTVVGGGSCDSDHDQLPTETAGDGDGSAVCSQQSPSNITNITTPGRPHY